MMFLVTNDDGIFAPALRKLQAELVPLGRVVIVAPDRDQSATSHSLTLHRPFRIHRHEPDVYVRIAHVLLPKDYVRFRLTGERATDVADASGTLLLDVPHRRWSEEVLAALELPSEWLPRVLESPEVSGETKAGVPVAAGAMPIAAM